MRENNGVCFLIGAGPGSAELLTLLGKARLAEADVVLYDALIDGRMLAFARPDAELIPVGKRSGQASMKQAEINKLLCERVSRGEKAARLKGGDPFIFGRGGEEAEALAARGLRFEVVPGVTAAAAAGANAGIPLTHRGVAASVALVAGREAPGTAAPPKWDALAKGEGTICVYMGAEKAGGVARALMAGGRPGNEPAAIVERAGCSAQKTRVLDLGGLAALDEREVGRPALIIVGGVVGLRDRLRWLERKPLYDKRILVARARTGPLETLLETLGAEALSLPVFSIVEPEFANRGGERDELTSSVAALADLRARDRPDWVLFTSRHAVAAVWNRLGALKGDARWFGGVRIAAVGAGTAGALERFALRPDLTAENGDANGLALALLARLGGAARGGRFLHFAGNLADGRALEALAAKGGICRRVEAYRNVPVGGAGEAYRALLESGPIDAVVFLSGSAVKAFRHALGDDFAPLFMPGGHGPALAALGKTAADALREFGAAADIVPEKPSLASLGGAIASYFTAGVLR